MLLLLFCSIIDGYLVCKLRGVLHACNVELSCSSIGFFVEGESKQTTTRFDLAEGSHQVVST